MNQLAATYPGTTTPLLANANWNRPVNLLKVVDLGYTYEDSSGTIFQGRRRRQLNLNVNVTKAAFDVSPRIDASGTSVASLKSAVLNRRKLTSAQVQQLKKDGQCRFQNDRLTPSQVSECVRRGTTQGVRLDGPNKFEGRVEVLINGRWYSVCDGGWDNNDASVVCRQLGHSEGVAVDSPRWFYKRTSYFVTNVQCRGYERLVQDCPYTTPTYSNGYCPGYGYAQVRCKSGKSIFNNIFCRSYITCRCTTVDEWRIVWLSSGIRQLPKTLGSRLRCPVMGKSSALGCVRNGWLRSFVPRPSSQRIPRATTSIASDKLSMSFQRPKRYRLFGGSSMGTPGLLQSIG